MRQVMVRVPHGHGSRVLECASEHRGVNASRWDAAGSEGERYEMILVHLPNSALGPFADDLEPIPDVHLSYLGTGAVALRPPKDEIADQTQDVSAQSPLEVYLAGLQSIGSWRGFLGYAALAGVVVWLGLVTNTVSLLVGAMLIAPFASPAMNSAVATARGDGRLLARSLARYAAALAVTIVVAALLTLVFRQRDATEQMMAISRVSPAAFLLPLAAGAAGALTLLQSQRSSLVSGAGAGLLVAASLAPPAGAIGVAMAIGRWDLLTELSFLLGLQLVGIDLAGAAVFRAFGVRPQGSRYPRGSRGVAVGATLAFVAGLAGLLAWQFGSGAPTLMRSGLHERAREVVSAELRGDADVQLLDVDAALTRPRGADDHPLLVRAYVRRLAGATRPPDALSGDLETRLARVLARRLPGALPLVDVTVVEAPPP